MNEFTAGFGQSPQEQVLLRVMLANLLDRGIEFDVRDDRGGTGQWFVVVRTSASRRILPDIERWVATKSTPALGANPKRWSEGQALESVLNEVEDFLEGQADSRDGGDGKPLPNEAMVLHESLRAVRAIERLRR